MTQTLVALSEFELSIDCDHKECPNIAVVSVKGCSDVEPWLICRHHFNGVSDHVSEMIADGPVICEGCYRPIFYMSTHYEVSWL